MVCVAYFPTRHHQILINFTTGIWRIIKGWLDPVVAKKVNFISNVNGLEKFISRNQIPEELGGEEKWTYQYLEPVAGENNMMENTAGREELQAERDAMIIAYEKNTSEWSSSKTDPLAGIKANRETLITALQENYWQLDPYIRARTHYDRAGILNPGGVVKFY
jgi:hypothetical protein